MPIPCNQVRVDLGAVQDFDMVPINQFLDESQLLEFVALDSLLNVTTRKI